MPTPTGACSLAVLALLTAGLGARVLVPRVGDGMASSFLVAAGALRPARPSSTDAGPLRVSAADAPVTIAAGSGDALSPGRAPGRATSGGGLDIPAERLARLTARQLRGIGASDAVDPTGHALGARLSGVGALGVGLADGDVVTSIEGRATPNATEATTAALASYASGEATAHATVLRGGRTLRVTVHIPARHPGATSAR